MKAKTEKTRPRPDASSADTAAFVSLGGRWYYDPRGNDRSVPREFDHSNADRLYYRTDRFETPFADNMSAWLRKGDLDRAGHLVKKDRFVADNVRLTFTQTHLVVRLAQPAQPSDGRLSRPLAGLGWKSQLHPGAEPDVVHPARAAGEPGTRRYGSEQRQRALPGGPIGIAVNGVIFFNPFDADSVEAIWRLDRCCGHPSPGFEYHYHKYPVCVKSPWTDDGTGHSPLIGFAFDGFPIFGPYEAAGELARDSQKNPLNAFNIHHR